MTPHRPIQRPRPAWLLSWLITVGLLAALVLLPEAAWEAIWPDGRLRSRDGDEHAGHVFELVEVSVVRPLPPVVETIPDPPDDQRRPARPEPEAAWWTQAWDVRIDADLGRALVLPDSLVPAPLVEIWGAQATLDLILATPDSLLEAQLWQLVNEQQLGRNDLSGLYSAIAKARSYVDMKRRGPACSTSSAPIRSGRPTDQALAATGACVHRDRH